MFGHMQYVPVLKGKRAEFPALESLHSFSGVTPLMEPVPTQPADYVPQKMSAIWPDDRPFFIDLLFLDEEEMEDTEANEHALRKCF